MPADFRLDHVHHGGGGDRRVEGVAARLQDVEPGLGGDGLAGRHHAVAGQGFQAGLARPAIAAIAADRVDRLPAAVAAAGRAVQAWVDDKVVAPTKVNTKAIRLAVISRLFP